MSMATSKVLNRLGQFHHTENEGFSHLVASKLRPPISANLRLHNLEDGASQPECWSCT